MKTRKYCLQVLAGVALSMSLPISNAPASETEALIVSTVPIDSGRQMLLVINTETNILAVYHIENGSGEISLRSTRALGYDLQLEDFNAKDPKPAAIKKMLRIDSAPSLPANRIEIIPPSTTQSSR